MGCCFSGEEEAKETELPAPAPGQAVVVKLQKQGMFDADYDACTPPPLATSTQPTYIPTYGVQKAS